MRHVDCGDCWEAPQCESCARLEAEIVAHTIRSPEAEAYWREKIAGELGLQRDLRHERIYTDDTMQTRVRVLPLIVEWDAAIAFVRGNKREESK